MQAWKCLKTQLILHYTVRQFKCDLGAQQFSVVVNYRLQPEPPIPKTEIKHKFSSPVLTSFSVFWYALEATCYAHDDRNGLWRVNGLTPYDVRIDHLPVVK